MKLFTTELNRFWGRRITRGVILIAVLLSMLAAGLVFAFTGSADDDNRAAAVERAEEATQQCVFDITNEIDNGNSGFFDPRLEVARDELSDAEFAELLADSECYQDPDWYESENIFWGTSLTGLDQVADWSAERPTGERETYGFGSTEYTEPYSGLQGVIPSIAVFFLVLSVVVGASFMGAEYKFGTVENLLLWEPRRSKVLGTKFAAGFVSSMALTFGVLAFLGALLYFVSVLKGTTAGIDGRFWIDLLSVMIRASVAGGLFFVIAMSVAVLARNTTASVGLILGWFVVSNILINLVLKFFRRWELFTNAIAFMTEGDAPKIVRLQNFDQSVFGHGYRTAGLVLAVWALAFATAATVAFNRRDVD